jgi:hypothetical protein
MTSTVEIMAEYTTHEMVNMVLCYGESQRSFQGGCTLYQHKFPTLRHPSANTFRSIVHRFLDTGSVQQRPRSGRPRTATDEQHSVMVLAAVATNPHTSSRVIAHGAGISQSSVLNVLHAHKFHPYHIHCHQGLEERDYGARVDFCNWLLVQLSDNIQFLEHIMWSDESQFCRDGTVNKHNVHYWADINPRWLQETAHQVNWRVNVWCGLFNSKIVGPIFYDGTLTGNRFEQLILNGIVEQFFDNLPLALTQNVWFQLDGAPPHYAINTRQRLHEMFHNQWIGRGGPVQWPPRSPDLTPMDFFLWGHIKETVYAKPTTTIEDLKDRISAACASISQAALRSVYKSIEHRAQLCIGADGHHIEHILH